jgi:2-keto-4-pentenoate hydratase/2-oxohepta-3-ene-1,7-dioic acid hydratase in catechol pathway
MHLATVATAEATGRATAAAVQDGDGWVLLDAGDLSALFAQPDWREAAQSALASSASRVSGDAVRLLTPLPHPTKVICCGLNYREHILETGRDIPEFPTLFAKYADTLTDPHADITIPADASAMVDWEAELVVVVGADLHRADVVEAGAGVLGYTVANDISMRDWQRRTVEWLQGKAFDRTTPVGPVVVTADAFDPSAGADIACHVNGESRQHDDIGRLVFDAATLVSYISGFTRLRPGDLILTGTPGGVALGMAEPRYLEDGDVVTTSISGIGTLRNRIRFEAAETVRS